MEFTCCAKNSKECQNVEKTYTFLRTLADPNRLKIICMLQRNSHCVCELVEAIGISDKLVSHHLKQLKNINLVNEKREGNFIRYSLDKKSLEKYKQTFNQIIK